MKINIANKIKSKKGLLVVTLHEEDIKNLPSNFPTAVKNFVRDRVKSKQFTGKKGETISTFLMARGLPEQLLLVGAGSKEKFSGKVARELGGSTGKFAKSSKATEVSLLSEIVELGEFLEGFIMVQHNVGNFKTGKEKVYRTESFNLILGKKGKGLEEDISHAQSICEAVDFIKDLVNSPANEITADYM
ncbi:MAG: hypothetical protein O3B47_02505, partial [bacterium]|nr:hypothetical protein [bacterium]